MHDHIGLAYLPQQIVLYNIERSTGLSQFLAENGAPLVYLEVILRTTE